MDLFGKIAGALGVASTRQEGLASPWASSDHLEAVTMAGLFGDVSGLTVNRARAMSLDMVSLARRRIAGTIGRLPLIDVDSAGARLSPRGILDQPETAFPRSATITWTVDQLMFYPWAHWLIVDRDAESPPNYSSPASS